MEFLVEVEMWGSASSQIGLKDGLLLRFIFGGFRCNLGRNQGTVLPQREIQAGGYILNFAII